MKEIEEDLQAELLDRVVRASLVFFEKLVVELLISMNDGGAGTESGRRVGRTEEGGIDGIINRQFSAIRPRNASETVGNDVLASLPASLATERWPRMTQITSVIPCPRRRDMATMYAAWCSVGAGAAPGRARVRVRELGPGHIGSGAVCITR
jgi:hypothetical protein